jgi:hypothetical protein
MIRVGPHDNCTAARSRKRQNVKNAMPLPPGVLLGLLRFALFAFLADWLPICVFALPCCPLTAPSARNVLWLFAFHLRFYFRKVSFNPSFIDKSGSHLHVIIK